MAWYVGVLFWVSLFYFSTIKYIPKKYANYIIGTISVTSYFIALNIHSGSLGSPQYTFGIFNMGFLRGFAGIGLGYFIGLWFKDNYSSLQNKVLNLKQKIEYTICEMLLLFVVVWELILHNTSHKYNISIVVFIVVLFILFILKGGLISNLFENNFSVYVAKYSYSVYITHLLVFALIKPHISTMGSFSIIPALIIPILFGVFTYHFVEEPCANYLKKKWFK